jgi:hypothetical protein
VVQTIQSNMGGSRLQTRPMAKPRAM